MKKASKEYYENRIKFLKDELKVAMEEFPADSAAVNTIKDALAWNEERLQLYAVERFYEKFNIDDTPAPEGSTPVDVSEIIFNDDK